MAGRRSTLLVVTVAALTAGACTSFDSPSIVADLRILGVQAEPPEVLIPADPSQIDLEELGEVEVCALVADPFEDRGLVFSMRACPPRNSGRCNEDGPRADLGSGRVDDPERAGGVPRICATMGPSPMLLEVLQESVAIDDLMGFGAIDVPVELQIRPDGGDDDTIEYATKSVRFGASIPEGRVANRNPTLDAIRVSREPTGERGLDFDLPIGRCRDLTPFVVSPGEQVTLLPREAADTREDYLVPTFDGGSRMFTESPTYHFYATAGSWTRFSTGGPRDFAGNVPTLFSAWTAPADPDEIGDQLDVALWVIQRDERGGQSWYPSCARVVP